MDRSDLIQHVLDSKIFKHWHYFTYHFQFLSGGGEHWMVKSILDACLAVERQIPGFASTMIDALADIGGKPKHEPHYEQLLQRLAELYVIRQIVTWPWPLPVKFEWEPTAGTSEKNPEVSIVSANWTIGVEVKAPSLLQHIRARTSHVTQISSRMFGKEELSGFSGAEEGVTMPRDNPVKDFLISADAKFAEFRHENPQFFGVLVIVWDDFIYEPISALIHKGSGLFTDASFARDEAGAPLKFTNVDTVVLIPHLHQLIHSTRDEPLVDGLELPLDYGDERQFPFKAYIHNPHGRNPPQEILDCLHAAPQEALVGAEYQPSDMIWWFNPRDPSSLGKRGGAVQTETEGVTNARDDTRLIERWLPIAEIGIESLRERTPMTPFPAPNRLHVWWARRPLVASRAAILASLLPADADHEKFKHVLGIHGDPVKAKIAIERARRTRRRLAMAWQATRARRGGRSRARARA